MNRVYKVIWSKAKHCYVVTSEIAKSHTKGESTGRGLKKLAAALLVAAALMGPNFAWAADGTAIVKDTSGVEQTVYTQKGAEDNFATKTDLAAKANAADVENTYAKTADVANTYVNKTDAQVTNLTVYRDVEAYGNLQVGNGNFTVSGITGNVTTGYATIGDDLTVKGDTEMKGDLSVKGTLNAADGKFSVGNDGQLSVSSGKFIVDTNGGINIGHGTATIDNNGNITGKKLDVGDTTVKSLDAGNGLIQTTGTVKAGDVQTGTLKAGATTVDSLDAGSGLIKTNGDISGTNITGTNITGTNITGDNVVVNDKLTTKNLAVTGGLEMNHITLGSEPTDNYTEINMGNVTSKNSKLSVDDGRTYTSTSNLTEKGRTDTAADGTTTNVSVMTAGGSDSTISSLADKNQKSYITQNMKNILQGIKNGTNESTINQTETGIKSIATDGKNNASTNLSNKGFNTFASDGGKNKTYTKQTAESLTSQIGDDGKVKSVMNADGITNITGDNTVTSDTNGTTFENKEHITAVKEGTVTKTTISGNTIETGQATMDYADVTKDLSVGGNAAVDGNTTLGKEGEDTTLTVNSTSTFNKDVTMKENATVEKDLTVNGESTLTGDVTMKSNATVEKDLTVNGESTLTGDVTMKSNATVEKDLTVNGESTLTGDVTMESNATVTKDLTVKGASAFVHRADFRDNVFMDENLTVAKETRTDTLYVDHDGYVGGNLNVEGNIETHDAVLSADSRQVVTGRQLYQTNERVDRLDNRIKKVGANAAALAALRPGDFNPDDKFSIAAGFGSYRNANAAALGLFYRPNENVLLSLGTSFGDGENMVNAGVSVKFGRGKSMAERRKEMADEVSSMRDEMRNQDERIAELEEMLKKQSELIEKLSKES